MHVISALVLGWYVGMSAAVGVSSKLPMLPMELYATSLWGVGAFPFSKDRVSYCCILESFAALGVSSG